MTNTESETKIDTLLKDKTNTVENVSLEIFKDLLARLSRIVDDPSISFHFNALFNKIEITIRGYDTRGDMYGFRKSFPITEFLTLDMLSHTIGLFEYEYKTHIWAKK